MYESANVYRSDPIRLHVTDDLQRSRLTVFFRLPLAFPHFVWLLLWGIAAFFAAIANWFVTLFRGRPAEPLHRFIAGLVRYQTHVFAFLQLVANPFPGFSGKPGTYPVEVEIDPPERQNRWKTAFRLILAFPAFMVSGALAGAAFVAAILSWFYALARGRVPRGLRNLGAFELRYAAQVYGYAYSAHRPLPVQRSLRRLADGADPGAAAAGRDASGDLTRVLKWLVPAALVVAAWVADGAAAVADGRSRRPARCRISTRAPTSSRAQLEEARDYERFTRINGVLSIVALLAVLVALRPSRRALHARVGGGAHRHRHAARDARVRVRVAGPAARSAWPSCGGTAATTSPSVGYVEWILSSFFSLGGVFLFVCAAVLIVMALARPFRERWWIPGAAVFVGLGLLFTFVGPFLLGDLKPLRNDRLAAQAKQLAREQGVSDIQVRVARRGRVHRRAERLRDRPRARRGA